MIGGQPLGLRAGFLRGGYDNHHVGSRVGMQILVGDLIDVFRSREIAGTQIGCGPRHRGVEVDVVEPGRTTAQHVDFHGVGGTQVSHVIDGGILPALVIAARGYAHLSQQRVVEFDRDFGVGTSRDRYSQSAGV